MAVTSAKPPMRLAMSPEGGPSRVVTTPTMSRSPCGVMCATRSAFGSTWSTADSVDSETTLPKIAVAGDARRSRPGGSARWCPAAAPGAARPAGRRWPGRSARSAKLPNSGWYTADLAPVGSAVADLGDDQADVVRRHLHPRVALDPEDGHSLKRRPGMSRSAW